MAKKELPLLLVEDQLAFEAWLEENHAVSDGIWLQIAKKGSCVETVTYAEAVESALCYGWIDSQKKAYDEQLWLQRFTPRGRDSVWSEVNKVKAEELLAAGRMKPSGVAAVEAAKASGRWVQAYAPQSRAEVPEDLAAALAARPKAKAFFETLDSANRYAVLYRVGSAKRAETRRKRIEKYVEMLERGEKIHQ
ncbi:MAG TPA: YdeI/OmpD-associated family protein [Bacillales bacterium]|nr:YdeI/OmpD-associated family protein [Bacillales bacterium]